MDKLELIASMAATLEAGDRAARSVKAFALDTPPLYTFRAYELYLAAIEEIRVRDDAKVFSTAPKQEEAA